jgi:hypothetical protein
MAISLLNQALKYDEGLLVYLFDEATLSAETHLHSTKLAEKLLDAALRSLGKVYIVIDGLDECAEDIQRHVATWLKRFVESTASEPQPASCAFFSQDDRSTRSLLSTLPSITIQTEDNTKDIAEYCTMQVSAIAAKFLLGPDEADEIARTTTKRAEGEHLRHTQHKQF